MDKIHFANTIEYIKHIVEKNRLSLDIRKIENKLFIEKIQFLQEANRDKDFIFGEILNHPFNSIKSIPAKIKDGNIIVDSKFRYRIESGPMLIYMVWIDKDGYLIRPDRNNFLILESEDTFDFTIT